MAIENIETFDHCTERVLNRCISVESQRQEVAWTDNHSKTSPMILNNGVSLIAVILIFGDIKEWIAVSLYQTLEKLTWPHVTIC